MSQRKAAEHAELTDYEKEQIRQIAAWKSEPPNPLSELWKMITLPAAKLVERVIPDSLVRTAIDRSYDTAELLAGRKDIRKRGKVRSLPKLRLKPLEECDALAKQVGTASQAMATTAGAATGAGGPLTTLADVPLLFTMALRTILKIGHCYGYPLDQRKDRPLVVGVLITAISGSLEIRRERLGQIRELEDLLLEETQEEILTEEALTFLFQLEEFEEVPGIGAVSGALLNLAFMHRVDVTARRIFQERWLRDNGKMGEIAPAEVPAHQLATGWTGAVGRAAYSVCYGITFGMTFPIWMVASLFRPLDNAETTGVREGSVAATETTAQAITRMHAETPQDLPIPQGLALSPA
jgi:EcsC protein family